MQHIRPVLELLRISNLPTVWSNVVAGAGVALLSQAGRAPAHGAVLGIPWAQGMPSWALLLAILAASAAYLGGMALNDVLDVHVDRLRDADRPIVSGRMTRSAAGDIAVSLLAAALLLAAPLGLRAMVTMAALLAAIIAYNALHHCSSGSVLLMGLCRAAAVLFGAAAMRYDMSLQDQSHGVWAAMPLAITLALYTALLTVIARREDRERDAAGGHPLGWRRYLALLLPLTPLLLVPWRDQAIGYFAALHLEVLLVMGLTTVWLGRAVWQAIKPGPQIRQAVMGWIAGMALIDALALVLAGAAELAWFSLGCFALTLLAHRRISGT